MSENSEPIDTEQQNAVAALSQRRILWSMFAAALLGSVLGFVFVSWQFGTGVLFGGILSLVNYYWLKTSLKNVFENAVGGEKPRFLAGKYFLRYLAFGAVLAIVFLTKTLPVISVLLGLASFAFAIVIEALIFLFSSFLKK
jgi:hypothetical protein